MYGGMEVLLHTFLTSPLDGGEWLVSCPSHSPLAVRVSPDMVAKRQSPLHLLGIEPQSSSPKLS